MFELAMLYWFEKIPADWRGLIGLRTGGQILFVEHDVQHGGV